jgi:branched-chain amino acid transport system ATP-binding protein
MLLEVADIRVRYGQIEAVKGITLVVDESEIVTLIGANGAGKTTTFRAISGLRKVSSSTLRLEGQDITHLPGHKRVQLGICQVPEGRGVFPGMSVAENLAMSAYARRGRRQQLKQDFDRVYALFPRLAERRRQPGGTLSGGE